MRGVDVYFDATAWISTYYAETDALTTLKKVLTQDDFDQIYELIKKAGNSSLFFWKQICFSS